MKQIITYIEKYFCWIFYFFTIIINVIYFCFIELFLDFFIIEGIKYVWDLGLHLNEAEINELVFFLNLGGYFFFFILFITYHWFIWIKQETFIRIFGYLVCISVSFLIGFFLFGGDEFNWDRFRLIAIALLLMCFGMSLDRYHYKKNKKR